MNNHEKSMLDEYFEQYIIKEMQPLYDAVGAQTRRSTAYNFTNWSAKELIDFTENPPTDVEARDWKNLAKELKKQLFIYKERNAVLQKVVDRY